MKKIITFLKKVVKVLYFFIYYSILLLRNVIMTKQLDRYKTLFPDDKFRNLFESEYFYEW